MNKALDRAARKDGSVADFAAKIGAPPPMVYDWIKEKRPVPHKYCPAIETVSGIHCEVLRPEVTWLRDESGRVTHYKVAV